MKTFLIGSAVCFFFTNICFGLQPTDLSFFAEAKPGDIIPVKLTIVNERDVEEKIDLNLCDYTFNSKGEHFYEEPKGDPRSSARWIELPSKHLDIPAKSQAEILYNIHIPKDLNLNGTYWNVILIEPADALPVDQEQKKDQFQLLVKIRYAYHVVINIGKGEASLKITDKKFGELEGIKTYQIDVVNDGTLYLKPKLSLKLYDDQGILVTTLKDQEQRIYPTTSVRYNLNMTDLKPNTYTGFLLLDNGDKHLFGDKIELTIP